MDPADYDLTSLSTTEDDNTRSFYPDYDPGDTTYDIYYGEILEKLSLAFSIIISVFGIIGNGLVIWIAGFRMKKTISAAWFLHLAIADFLFCADLSMAIVSYLDLIPDASNVNLSCLLIVIPFTINMTTSVLLLTAMSIDRCVSVLWPFWAKFHRTRRLVRITAGGIWGFSFFLVTLKLYLHGWCINPLSDKDHFYTYNLIMLVGSVILFVIPFLIILTSYLIILLKLRKSKRPQRSQRTYRIIIAIVLCFFICWSPYYIESLIPKDYLMLNQVQTILVFTSHLPYLNSCLNPIIYVFMGQNIKPYFFRSIPARIEHALSEHPEEPNRKPGDLELQ